MKFSLIEIEITTIVSLFLLCLFSIQRYFFVACFTFRRDYEDSARYAFSAVESGIEIYKMDGSLSRIIFPTIDIGGVRNELRIASQQASRSSVECFDLTLYNECVG